jgi:hypothetical protein
MAAHHRRSQSGSTQPIVHRQSISRFIDTLTLLASSLPSSPSRKPVAVWWISRLTEIIDHHHFTIASAQSNIPVHGLHGESTKLHPAGNGLSAGARRRHSSTTGRHRVSCLPSNAYQGRHLLCSCVISTLCIPNLEFQLLNPTTQVALFSVCVGQCSSLLNITWHVYEGSLNGSSPLVRWRLFNLTSQYENVWFFGRHLPPICALGDEGRSRRSTHHQLHCHQRALPRQQSHRLLASRSDLHLPVGAELECPELRHQSVASKWIVLDQSTQWNDEHSLLCLVSSLVRRGRNQRLCTLRYD